MWISYVCIYLLTFVIHASRLQLASIHIEIHMAGWFNFAKNTSICVNDVNIIGVGTIQFPRRIARCEKWKGRVQTYDEWNI